MIDLKKIQSIVFILLLLYSCSNDNEKMNRDEYKENVFNELKTVTIDSVMNIDVDWRSHNLLMLRYNNHNDSFTDSFGVPFLLKRTEDDLIRFKTINNNWEVMDSFNNHFQIDRIKLSNERMSYCFNLMEKSDLLSISNINESTILFSFKDHISFYYIYEVDSVFFKKYKFDETLKQLDNNWWVAP